MVEIVLVAKERLDRLGLYVTSEPKNIVESQKSMQATNAPSKFKKLLITNKVTTHS